MIDNNNVSRLIGAAVLDSNGAKIGILEQIYAASGSGTPRWMRVRTGLFGTSHAVVPAPTSADDDSAGGTTGTDHNAVRVAVEKAFVKRAPRIETEGPLNPSDEEALGQYYGLAVIPAGASPSEIAAAEDQTVGRHSSGHYSPDDMGEPAASESGPSLSGTDDAPAPSLAAPASRPAAQGRHRAEE